MKRVAGRPLQKGRHVLGRRLLAAMEFHRHYSRSGFGGTMTWREAAEHVAREHGFSRATVENHARAWRRPAIAWLRANATHRDAEIPAVFDAFGDELDEVDAASIIAAARAVKLEATERGVPFATYLRWHEGRARLLELIRAFAA